MKTRFMPRFLFISGGAIEAFASIDLFFFLTRFTNSRDPPIFVDRNLGQRNRVAAAWKITIYLAIGSFILLLGLILLYQSFPLGIAEF